MMIFQKKMTIFQKNDDFPNNDDFPKKITRLFKQKNYKSLRFFGTKTVLLYTNFGSKLKRSF